MRKIKKIEQLQNMTEEKKYKLTDKQEKFCKEYIIDLNATKAALKAGYSKDTAYAIGHENLKKVEIQLRLSELKKEWEEKSEVTCEMLTREWKKIAFSKFTDLHNTWIERKEFEQIKKENPGILDCIESIDTKTIRKKEYTGKDRSEWVDVEHIKIKLFSKERALENLGKRIGYYKEDNKQKTPQKLTEEDRERLIDELIQRAIK